MYKNEVIGGYVTRRVLSILVNLSIEAIALAISCEHCGTKFMNSWGDELEDHFGHSLWGTNWAKTSRHYGTLLSKAKIFE